MYTNYTHTHSPLSSSTCLGLSFSPLTRAFSFFPHHPYVSPHARASHAQSARFFRYLSRLRLISPSYTLFGHCSATFSASSLRLFPLARASLFLFEFVPPSTRGLPVFLQRERAAEVIYLLKGEADSPSLSLSERVETGACGMCFFYVKLPSDSFSSLVSFFPRVIEEFNHFANYASERRKKTWLFREFFPVLCIRRSPFKVLVQSLSLIFFYFHAQIIYFKIHHCRTYKTIEKYTRDLISTQYYFALWALEACT